MLLFVLLVFVLQYPQNVTILLFVLQYSRNVSQTRWIIDDERMGEASVEVPSILSVMAVTFSLRLFFMERVKN
jgi:hypothetical protein